MIKYSRYDDPVDNILHGSMTRNYLYFQVPGLCHSTVYYNDR